MKNPNQLTSPTASQYLDSVQRLINILRNVPADRWSPGDISLLHEVDSMLDDITFYFSELDDAKHEPDPDDYEPES